MAEERSFRTTDALLADATAGPGAKGSKRRLKSLVAGPWDVAREWPLRPEFWALLVIVVVILVGGAMRAYRLDMPPIDYPEDRQRSNMLAIDVLNAGRENQRARFMELRVYPAIVSLCSPVGTDFGAEAWTVARTCSVVFGTLTIAFAAMAGWLMAPPSRAGRGRRSLMALIMACAIAFNPYHVRLSRIITTEPLTIMFQAAALAFFLLAMHDPRRLWRHFLFLAFFALACLSKLPSLMWAPAFFFGYGTLSSLTWRWRAIGAIAAGGCAVGILLFLGLNPLTIFKSYGESFGPFAEQMREWIGHPLWNRTYFSSLVAILRLPTLVLGLIGFFVAPWIYRTTMLIFLTGFYFLTNLNTYNFAHGILPGTCLAVWGLMFMLEAGPLRHGVIGADTIRATTTRLGLAHRFWGGAIAFALFVLLWRHAPGSNADLDAKPKGFYLQSVEVIGRIVPPGEKVVIDNSIAEYLIKRQLGRSSSDLATREDIDTSSGWYYSFRRMGQTPMRFASMAWVRWASIPGEFEGILYMREPLTIEPGEMEQYLPLSKDPSTPPQGGLDLEVLLVPRLRFDPTARLVRVTAGESLTVGMQWNNLGSHRIVSLASRQEDFQLLMPLPVRQGGLVLNKGVLLNVPHVGRRLMRYTFEFPPHFPPGRYTLAWYPFAASDMTQAGRRVQPVTLPVQFEVGSPSPATFPIDLPMVDLYPDHYDYPPNLWSEDECYVDMRPEGVTHGSNVIHLMATPGAPAGHYRLTLRGSGVPIYDPLFPENLWPTVIVSLPGVAEPVAEIPFESEKTGDFSAEFEAPGAFNALRLDVKIIGAAGGRTPPWWIDFNPGSFGPEGMQYINMRRARLSRRVEKVEELGVERAN